MTYTFKGKVVESPSTLWSRVLVTDKRMPNFFVWLPKEKIYPIGTEVHFEVSVSEKEPE